MAVWPLTHGHMHFMTHQLCRHRATLTLVCRPLCVLYCCCYRPTFSEILATLIRLRQKLGGHTPALGRYQPQPCLLAQREREQLQAAMALGATGGTGGRSTGSSTQEQQKQVWLVTTARCYLAVHAACLWGSVSLAVTCFALMMHLVFWLKDSFKSPACDVRPRLNQSGLRESCTC